MSNKELSNVKVSARIKQVILLIIAIIIGIIISISAQAQHRGNTSSQKKMTGATLLTDNKTSSKGTNAAIRIPRYERSQVFDLRVL